MSDFHQHGLITTLHRLHPSTPSLQGRLRELAKERPLLLALPCHGSEIGTPALARIVHALAGVDYLQEIVVSMNGVASGQEQQVCAYFQPIHARVLFNDGEKLDALAEKLGLGHGSLPPGKGTNLRAAIADLSQRYESATLACHDCDIVSYEPVLLERLLYPVAEPEFEMAFAKGYYSRVKDRLYGRLTRLFFIPLLRAFIRVAGHQPLLDFLDCFRYPLAGEFSGKLEELRSMPLACGWGLEIGMLCEWFRRVEPRRICQVDLAIEYDHKHQPLRTGDGTDGGLVRMCREVARELFTQLQREGLRLDGAMLDALVRAYRRSARETVSRYELDARINAIAFEREREIEAVEAFGSTLEQLAGAFATAA